MVKKEVVVLTEKEIEQVEELASGLSYEQIADYFGIDQSTFYDIKNRQPEVSRAYEKGRASTIAVTARILMKKIQNRKILAKAFNIKQITELNKIAEEAEEEVKELEREYAKK